MMLGPPDQGDDVLVEIRRYAIKPGLRDEFARWFESEVVPAMEAAGMRILGVFTGVEDPDAFFYMRAFADEEERERRYRDFYQSPTWLGGMREKALAMEDGYQVDLVRSTPGSRI